MRLGGTACAQVIGLTCESLGPCAYGRPDARSRRAASAGSVADGLELWGSDGSRALLLAVLTLQCAAKPHWWHGGQSAQATTHRANVRSMRSQKWGLPGSQASAPPGIRQRRDPEGSRLSLRAVRAGPSAPETQRPSLSSATAAAVESGANAQFFHQPLTVSTAWVPRSDSAEWALTRPEDRRAAWNREATFSQFTRFHQALT